MLEIDLENLTLEQREQAEKIINEIELRKLKYPMLEVKLQPFQKQFLDALAERNEDGLPRWKFIIFLGGNGSGKTFTMCYLTMLMAMGRSGVDYGLPYVGEAKLIKVYTTTGDNIRDNIDRKYMLGTGTNTDKLKFPGYVNKDDMGEVIKWVRHEKELLKEVKLYNGAVITFGTYDQGQSRLQGGEPDLTWMDELPTRYEDLTEIFRGTRNKRGQLIISATPTNYNKKIKDYLFNDELKDVLFIKQIDSYSNVFGDHTWMRGLTEEDKMIKRFGSFTPPEGLVYKNFSKYNNVIPRLTPREMGEKTKFYGAIDFGVNHPMAFLFIGVDADGRVIVFDEIYKSGMLLGDLAKEIKKKKREHGIDFEWIVADSSGSRERAELKHLGINTKGANKRKKEGNMSNRRGGIFKINQLLGTGKLFVTDNCESIINEFESHHFSSTGEDGAVEKTGDDALDSLRYFIFEYTSPSEVKELIRKRKKVISGAVYKNRGGGRY